MSDLPEVPVPLTILDIGWLIGHNGFLDRCRDGDLVARGIYRKLKAAAIGAGVGWYYGDPWKIENE